jgi:SAM-dependent methyltransferase
MGVAPDDDALNDAMSGLRGAVGHQLGVDRPEAADVEVESLVRFGDIPTVLDPQSRRDLVARAAKLDPWLQGPFLLGGDLVIGGTWRTDHRWETLGEHLPDTIVGASVLDVGSNAGYDPFMFRQRGAGRVVGCEPFVFIEQARFLESIYKSGAEFLPLGWQQLDPAELGTFDIVHCHGVLYHDLNPVALLQRLHSMLAPGGTLLFGTMMLDDPELSEYARFVPGEYYGDPTWWWVPGRLTTRWMIEAAGFAVVEEFGLNEGPRGEFPVINGYLRATRATPPAHAPTAWSS